ncbi:MAG: hypothetical protein KA163_06295 [Bacteroidia bacterium]|nr:hypothetical protein [Bacteroidia bacterium]
MRITLILFAFIYISLNAQDGNKAALTAGSEFLKTNESSQSITAGQTMMVFETAYRNEVPTLNSVKTEYGSITSGKLNPLIYVLVFILIGIAFYFIRSKNKVCLNTSIHLEEEEEQLRKKELWDAMAEPDGRERL